MANKFKSNINQQGLNIATDGQAYPALCNVVSSTLCIYQLCVPHFAMSVFMCLYLHYMNNGTRRSNFPQFS